MYSSLCWRRPIDIIPPPPEKHVIPSNPPPRAINNYWFFIYVCVMHLLILIMTYPSTRNTVWHTSCFRKGRLPCREFEDNDRRRSKLNNDIFQSLRTLIQTKHLTSCFVIKRSLELRHWTPPLWILLSDLAPIMT